MKRLAPLFLLIVVACTTPQTPAQAVYQLTGNYGAALEIAVAYKRLPTCLTTGAPLCSQPSVVAALQKADDVAFAGLTAAQNAVRSPLVEQSRVMFFIAAAREGITAFESITATLKVK